MRRRISLAIPAGLLAALPGCANASAANPFSQAHADAITAECGAPRELLSVQDGAVTIWPKPGSDYEASACVLKEIKDAGVTKFGFVGNEVTQSENER